MTYHDDPERPRIEPRLDVPDTRGGVDLSATGERQERTRGRGRFVAICIAVIALGGFAGVAWHALIKGQSDSAAVVPVIPADPSPIKVLPEKPGGLEVPNRDKLVYMQIDPDKPKPPVERLLPPPEKPLARPAPSASDTGAIEPPSGPLVPEAPVIVPRGGASESPAAKAPAKAPKKKQTAVPSKAASPAKSVQAKAGKQTASIRGYQIQLGAIKSKARAVNEAARLSRIHKRILGGRKVRAVRADLGRKGVYYRLRAGPLKSMAAARDICRKLTARKLGCAVIKP